MYAEAGSGRFMLNLAETYAPLPLDRGAARPDVEAWLDDQRRASEDGTSSPPATITPM